MEPFEVCEVLRDGSIGQKGLTIFSTSENGELNLRNVTGNPLRTSFWFGFDLLTRKLRVIKCPAWSRPKQEHFEAAQKYFETLCTVNKVAYDVLTLTNSNSKDWYFALNLLNYEGRQAFEQAHQIQEKEIKRRIQVTMGLFPEMEEAFRSLWPLNACLADSVERQWVHTHEEEIHNEDSSPFNIIKAGLRHLDSRPFQRSKGTRLLSDYIDWLRKTKQSMEEFISSDSCDIVDVQLTYKIWEKVFREPRYRREEWKNVE